MSAPNSTAAVWRYAIAAAVPLIGLLFIMWSLSSLHGIFEQEHDDANQELQARRRALVQFAVKSATEILQRDMASAWPLMQRNLADPLLASNQYVYIVDGQQRLPRLSEWASYDDNRIRKLYDSLLHSEALELIQDDGSDWSQRLNLFSEFKLAIGSGNLDDIRWAFRRIREFDARANGDAQRTIAYMLAVLDYFQSHSVPSAQLLGAVLRGGGIVDMENRRFGLQRRLLLHRNRFNRDDFAFLADRIQALSSVLGVAVDDFILRLKHTGRRVSVPSVTTPTWTKDNWYVEPFAQNGLRGMRIRADELMLRIQNDMQFLGLLGDADLLELHVDKDTALANLNISVLSPHWPELENAIAQRFRIKTVLLVSSALLLAGTLLLIAYIVLREQRLLNIKAEFIATVTHELRTPLASIRLLAETLQRKLSADSSAKDYPQRIVKDIDSLGLLLENILSFNRLQKNQWALHIQTIELSDLLNHLEDDAHLLCDKPLSIDRRGMDGVILRADPELMQILFGNLLSNACKYNDHDAVCVCMSVSEGSLSLRDNGIGIERAHWRRVFRQFFRDAPARQRSIRGTGLGLAICQKIMQLHGGDMMIIDSGAWGTEFTLQFGKVMAGEIA